MPGQPLPTDVPGWSPKARQEWLDGAAAPNPADLFRRLCDQITRFVYLPPDRGAGTVATLALWIILTYIYYVFDAVPYLNFGGPLGSGKTRQFEIL
jgi:hypothetical protein